MEFYSKVGLIIVVGSITAALLVWRYLIKDLYAFDNRLISLCKQHGVEYFHGMTCDQKAFAIKQVFKKPVLAEQLTWLLAAYEVEFKATKIMSGVAIICCLFVMGGLLFLLFGSLFG